MEQGYSIKDLLFLFLHKIWWLILGAVLGATALFCYSNFYLPLEYSSHISMYIQSYKTINTNNSSNLNDISNSKQLINTYMEVLKDDAVMRAVGEKLIEQYGYGVITGNFKMEDGNIAPESLRNTISITSVEDTSALKVVVTTKNADISASICNIISEVSPDFIKDAVGVGAIRTIDTAKAYYTPVAPNVTKNTLIGFLGGFMLVAVIILLIDFLDNTVKSTEIISEKYKKPIIGEIQQFGKAKKKRSSTTILDSSIPFNVIENYKLVRTNIMFSLSTGKKKIFAVSSANPSEGKSTTSVNIAIAFAQMENKVLLIDADMRKSVVHKTFSITNESGLSTVISKMNTFEESVHKNVIENLDILTAGPSVPNPSELLASENFENLISSLSQSYDYIIIDTPPVNIVSDVLTIKDSISGMLLVLKYGDTTYNDVDNCMKKIELADMNILGFILNDISHKKSGAYYSNYKYDYSYSYSAKEDKKKK
ncbi:MAG: polysaccharide biosynthesis tyrosine autokinase [Ruminococcus flavefaciens]|nr:polysaccharide biosynthesis tyrosine autokinase [Ruminococcus flavefaciens]